MDKKIIFAVLVAALGYFVDVYDLILFSVVRVASLKDILPPGADITGAGALLLNTQLAGMLLGGVLWGVYGDKKGRLSILFGSILLYSLANIANAFVTDIPGYAICRFLAGLGLAGELGAGITLVAEIMPKEKRGIGTAIVATVGVAGGLAAATVGDLFPWKTAYIVGGCMGLALFVLRVAVAESGLFTQMEADESIRRGDLRLLLGNASCLRRLLWCTLVGMPLWFLAGMILTFAPEIGRALELSGAASAGRAVFWFYSGLVFGDLASGLYSQWLRSRRKALAVFIGGSLLGTLAALNLPAGASPEAFYAVIAVTGFFSGYWAMFVTVAAENFGTNLRATVATSVPNLVRGAPILMTTAFALTRDSLGVVASLELIGGLTFAAAFYGLWRMQETFGVDLEYVE